MDVETGYYYLQSRYYDPALRRFISSDNYDLISTLAESGDINLFAYCGNNPVNYKLRPVSSGTACPREGMVGSVNGNYTTIVNQNSSNISKGWINLKPISSWVHDAIDIADLGFSVGVWGLTAWQILKYPGFFDLMKLDDILSIPGKYSNFVEVLGYAFIVLETGIDMYSNYQQGYSAGYIIASGAYTLGAGLAIMYASAKIGASIGTAIGGPVGFIIGGASGVIIGFGLEWLAEELKEWIF